MAFFREFLMASKVIPDPRFDEADEAALVQLLLQARIRRSVEGVELKTGFLARREFNSELVSVEAQNALLFVAGFLCFFLSKPIGYTRGIEAFKEHFIPGFAIDKAKQARLMEGLRPEFFQATLESLATTETLDELFDTAQLRAAAGDPIWTTDLPPHH